MKYKSLVSNYPSFVRTSEFHCPKLSSRQPPPPSPLSPPRPCDEEEDGEGDIKANIKAEPPAGFPLSGWAREGCGQAFYRFNLVLLIFGLNSALIGYHNPLHFTSFFYLLFVS